MAARKIESRIPGDAGDFTQANADKLGQAKLNAPANNLALVSYLEAPLQYDADKKSIRNTYVTFDKTGDDNTYSWEIEFFDNSNTSVGTINAEGPVFSLDSKEEDILDGKSLSRVVVTVSVDSVPTQSLVLDQAVTGLNPKVEQLIVDASNGLIASAGNTDVTRILGNDYQKLLIDLKNKNAGADEITVNLLAALLYQAIESDAGFFSRLSDWFGTDEGKWVDYLESNDTSKLDSLVDSKIGIINVKPHFFYFISQPPVPGINDPYEMYVFDNTSPDEDLGKFEEKLLKSGIHNLSDVEKRDLFNKLRFPKSCLANAWTFLKNLKKRHINFIDSQLTKEGHSENRDCISTVVTEFESAPHKALDSYSSTAKQAYNIMYSQWMQAILEASSIPYKTIRVQVLDIRSGKALANKRVRKLVIHSNDHSIGSAVVFPYDSEEAQGSSVAEKSKFVLNTFGYTPIAVAGDVYGATAKQRYKDYWDHRVLDHSVPAIAAADQPPENMLQEIVDEYNQHRATDVNGVLNIKIPTNLFDKRKVYVDIQFCEFPISLEELDGSSGSPISRDSNSQIATDFSVVWRGDETDAGGNRINPQRAEWANYFNAAGAYKNAENFGWEVSKGTNKSMLKAVQRLVIKDDDEEFAGFDSSLFSQFYDSDRNPIHFVLFGMEWCQPIWNAFPNTTTHRISGLVNSGNLSANLPNDREQAGLMGVATRWDTRSANNSGRGRDYGTLIPAGAAANTPRGGNRHDGIDYTGVNGVSPVFTPYGGTFQPNHIRSGANQSNGYGNTVIITFQYNGGTYLIRLAHLNNNPAISVNVNDVVFAGHFIGTAGRTYNSGGQAEYRDGPTHLHLEVSQNNWQNRLPNPTDIFPVGDFYRANRELILLNNDSYRIFPCDCHGGKGPASDCAVRGGGNGADPVKRVSSHCWASRNLHCPYLTGRFRYKAQLTYLHEDAENIVNPLYLRPGDSENSKIDDSWDNSSQAAIRRFREKHQNDIYNFITNPAPPAGDPAWVAEPIDAATEQELNRRAPYPRVDVARTDI